MRIGIISLNGNVVLYTAALDLERVLQLYKEYYNKAPPHQGTDGALPDVQYGKMVRQVTDLNTCRWRDHCRGLFQLPQAA